MDKESKPPSMLSVDIIVWAIRLIVVLFVLTVLSGVIVVVLRYAFGIELWNPFHLIPQSK
jgi:hypothetical protein